MATVPAPLSGHTGFGSTALALMTATQAQVEQVAQFRAQPRDFSAPRMQLASSLPAAPLIDMQFHLDVTA